MQRFAIIVLISGFGTLPMVVSSQEKEPEPQKFMTGAKPTPFAKILEAVKSGKAAVFKAEAPPAKVIAIPPKLSMWGNSQYGCCVTSESCFAIACYSVYVGNSDTEIFIPEATAISWARAHGWLNGAFLLDVIQDMQADGIKDSVGTVRKAGRPSAVDYRDEETLKSAIAQGPVSIAIASNALPSGAGNANGWSVAGGRAFPNTDHCVSLGGYGSSAELFKALNVSAPANFPANGYLLFTWNTIGVVDHKWLLNTCVEAWVRNPTIVGLDPPPPPPPGKLTVNVADVAGGVGVPVKFSPGASGGTAPYIFLFEYGDGVQDASGSHTYKAAGSYKTTVTAVDSLGQVGTGTCIATIGSSPPPPPPIPGPGGYQFIIPQDIPKGTYYAVDPADLAEIQRRLDLITGKLKAPKK